MEIEQLLEIYKGVFETWRFQVDSHWQRSAYFAAFETVAIGACWKVLVSGYHWAGILLALLGIALTVVWFFNNNKTHDYARYWFEAVADIEGRLINRGNEPGIDFAQKLLKRPRVDLIPHPILVQLVPAIFSVAWLGLLSFGLKFMIQPWTMLSGMAGQLASLVISAASLAVAVSSVWIAKSSLHQAKQVADREQQEWNERKWIDMYLKANEVYDSLDRFHTLSDSWSEEEWQREWNTLMHLIRQAHALAVVFPINPAIEVFVNSTAVFRDRRAVSGEDLEKVFDAVEFIRDKAKMRPAILG